MNRAQANRTRVAARIAAAGARPSTVNPGSPLLIPVPTVSMSFTGRSRRAVRMTGAQRNAQGRTSEWNRSPYYRTSVTVDVRWSA